MNAAERYKLVLQLFDSACELPVEERRTFLLAHATDPDVRAEVESMLQLDAESDAFVDASAPGRGLDLMAADVFDPDGENALPEQVDRYRVLRRVGAGGMGVIYEAEQESPRRRVALKLLRPGLLNRELLRRFQHEAHVLGQLQHVGIAQIYEAGWANLQLGRQPYFAMEFIDGLPLGQYADQRELTTQERLELIARVCDAVQHAHQKGVIHRDLKPSNVLVVQQESRGADRDSSAAKVLSSITGDAIGQPKVLDFGIARVTDADVQTATMQTQAGQLVGTLAYMSPEQASGDSADLDTRCDVYALGVMLYELLGRARPHEMAGVSVPEAVRIVREDEPRLLGTRVRSLRGDVETIVAKAMAKERERRYASAAELATDIRRFLAHHPIEARPATALYQLRRFANRNRGLVGGLLATFVMLVITLITTIYGLVQADERRRIAVAANERLQSVVRYQAAMLETIDVARMGQAIVDGMRRDARENLNDDDATVAAQLAAFEQVLSRVNPTTVANAALDSSIVAPAVAALDLEFANQAELQAELRASLVSVYDRIGLDEKALPQAQAALATLRSTLGDQAPATLAMRQRICALYLQLGSFEACEREARSLLADQRAALGADHLQTLVTRKLLGSSLVQLTRPDEAEAEILAAIDGLTRTVGPLHEESLRTRRLLGEHYDKERRNAECRGVFTSLLADVESRYGPDHALTLDVLMTKAHLHFRLLEYDTAIEHLTRVSDTRLATLGADHPDTLASRRDLTNSLSEIGRYAEAEPILQDTLARQRATLGPDHPSTVSTLSATLRLMIKTQRWPEAESLGLQALAIARRTLGEDNSRTVNAFADLSFVYHKSRQYALAEEWRHRAIAAHQRVYGPEHLRTLVSQQFLAKTLIAAGKHAEALTLLSKMLPICQRVHPDVSIVPGTQGQLVSALITLGRGAEAESNARELLEWCERRGAGAATLAKCRLWIARAVLAQEDFDRAKPFLNQALDLIGEPEPAPWRLMLARALGSVVAIHAGETDRTQYALEQFDQLSRSELHFFPEEYNVIVPEVRRLLRTVGVEVPEETPIADPVGES